MFALNLLKLKVNFKGGKFSLGAQGSINCKYSPEKDIGNFFAFTINNVKEDFFLLLQMYQGRVLYLAKMWVIHQHAILLHIICFLVCFLFSQSLTCILYLLIMAETNGVKVYHSKTNQHFTDLLHQVQIPPAPIKSLRAVEKCQLTKIVFLFLAHKFFIYSVWNTPVYIQ